MSKVSQTISLIAAAVERHGLPAFSRASNVPYTTLLHWQKHGYRPKVIDTFEKLAAAAEAAETVKLKPRRKKAA